MKMKGLLLALLLLFCISVVSAEVSCSFINITQGPPGAAGTNGTNGVNGADGTSCTVTIGSVSSGSPASVTNVGTANDSILNFVIPPGATGSTGSTGSTGATGPAGTITINSTLTGTPASVTNIGTATAALLDFVIPAGDKGEKGDTGAANMTAGPAGDSATITINSTATGTPANVTNIGTALDAVFDFVIPAGEKGDKGDTGAIPDVTQYFFINTTRALTGSAIQRSVNDDYLNIIGGAVAGNQSGSLILYGGDNPAQSGGIIMSVGNATGGSSEVVFSALGRTDAPTLDLNNNKIVNLLDPTSAQDAATKNYVDTKTFSTFNTTYDTTTTTVSNNLANWNATYNATYDSLSSYNATYDTSSTTVANNLAVWNSTYNATYDVTSTTVENNLAIWNATYNSTYDAKPSSTFNTTYDTTSTTVTNNLAAWNATYNATYDALSSSTYNSTYDTTSTTVANNLAAWNATYNASYLTSTYNATYDAKLQNPIFGYVTLMAGSAMVTTTNPSTMTQLETSNGINYIALNFTTNGAEIAQWLVDFPADWNSTGNVIFTPIWTAREGTPAETCNWTIKARLFADDATFDTAVAQIGTSNDTLLATTDIHVAPPTTGAAITGAGNTGIIQISRDSSDTMAGTAQLIGLRVKYVTNKA